MINQELKKIQDNRQKIRDARIQEFLDKFGEEGYSLIFDALDKECLSNLSKREFFFLCKIFIRETIADYLARKNSKSLKNDKKGKI